MRILWSSALLAAWRSGGIQSFSMHLWLAIATWDADFSAGWQQHRGYAMCVIGIYPQVPRQTNVMSMSMIYVSIAWATRDCRQSEQKWSAAPHGLRSLRAPRDCPEEGIVETELLEIGSSSHSFAVDDDGEEPTDVQGVGYLSYFKVRWLESGVVSLCRGPPFQDVTMACDNGSHGSWSREQLCRFLWQASPRLPFKEKSLESANCRDSSPS